MKQAVEVIVSEVFTVINLCLVEAVGWVSPDSMGGSRYKQNAGKLRYKRKRKGYGNRYTKRKIDLEVEDMREQQDEGDGDNVEEINNIETGGSRKEKLSASAAKIDLSFYGPI